MSKKSSSPSTASNANTAAMQPSQVKADKAPKGVMGWVEHRLPVFEFLNKELVDYQTPKNLNYMWNFGSLAGIILVIMIMSGIFLAMQYTAHVDHAFQSVERIMREVNYGWLIRYIHMNGASMFFIVIYMHMFRGLYYGSYKAPRELLWIMGVVIYLLMMATAFMGYVLPWGQMSFWGATVITNFFTAFDINFMLMDTQVSFKIGTGIMEFLLGGFSVDNPTLSRFFALHYLMPFAIVAIVVLHLVALHAHGSNNPSGVDKKTEKDTVPFHPFYTYKDLFGLGTFLLIFGFFVFFAPNFFGEPDNYIPADPLVTPPHILPEWYFLPFYAILRSVPDKLAGVLLMFGAVGILAALPWLDKHPIRSGRFRPLFKPFFWLFIISCFSLGWAGAQPPEGLAVTIGQICTIYYFAYFLIVLPALRYIERPMPLPESIDAYEKERKKAKTKKKSAFSIAVMCLLGGSLFFGSTQSASAAGDVARPPKYEWSFKGAFGVFERDQLQRGFQVYKEVCSVCHGLNLLRYEKLLALGFSEEEIKAIAGEYEIPGPLNEDGEPTRVRATPGDTFASPYPNKNAARAANNGAYPPDLSLMVKARAHGADYLHALLIGYEQAPDEFSLMPGMYYNKYFSGGQIAMPPPLVDNQVEYADGTKATVDQMSLDVTAFLAWAAEPELEQRRNLGVKVIIFLLFFTFIMHALMRRTWRKIKDSYL